jgi:hypothetical protein
MRAFPWNFHGNSKVFMEFPLKDSVAFARAHMARSFYVEGFCRISADTKLYRAGANTSSSPSATPRSATDRALSKEEQKIQQEVNITKI